MTYAFLCRAGIGLLIISMVTVAAFVPFSARAANTHALDFERDDAQHLVDPDTSVLGITDELTVQAWVRAESIAGPAAYVIAGKRDPSDDRTFMFKLMGGVESPVQLGLQASSNGGGFNGDTFVNWTDAGFGVGTWHHVAATFDQGTVAFYVDGEQLGTDQASAISSLNNGDAPISIGAEMLSGPTDPFDGTIDDVRIWTRALSAAELAAVYEDACDDFANAETLNGSGLAGWWRLDNDATDSSVNANHLDEENGPNYVTDPSFNCDGQSVPTEPDAPTNLQTEGLTNPAFIDDGTPEFTALYNDVDTGDQAVAYHVQVSDEPTFASPLWDSGRQGFATYVNAGERTPEIEYGGPSFEVGTTYYWRIRMWDLTNQEGAWSTETATFSPAEPNTMATNLVKEQSESWYTTTHAGLVGTTQTTACAWINIDNVPVVNVMEILSYGAEDVSFEFFYTGQLGISINDQQSRIGWAGETRNTWYHVCGRYDGTLPRAQRARLYVDGTPLGNRPSDQTSIDTPANPEFAIGTRDVFRPEESSHRFFGGRLDDVRLWTRALSDTEIANIYANPGNPDLNGSNLGGWWKFEGNGEDSSGNGNDLTFNAIPFTSAVHP